MEEIEITPFLRETLEKHADKSPNIREVLNYICAGNIKSLIGQIQIEQSSKNKSIGNETNKNTNLPLEDQVRDDLLNSFVHELILGSAISIKHVFNSFISTNVRKKPEFLSKVIFY